METDYGLVVSFVTFRDIIPLFIEVAGVVVAYILIKNNIGSIMQFIKGKAK